MRLNQILLPVEKELDRVKELLKLQVSQILDRHVPGREQRDFFEGLLNRILNNPGKMLRPLLCIFSFRSVAKNRKPLMEEYLLTMAAAVELIHTASLVHDDIIDESPERRGEPSINNIFNNKIAVLAGDILYSQFFSLIVRMPIENESTKLRILDIFCDVSQKMCLGEINQHRIIKSNNTSEQDEYMDILKNKTAVLMSACCRCGALLAGADEVEEQNLSDFGLHFGLAFQLADDLKDGDAVFSDTEKIRILARSQVEKALLICNELEDREVKESLSSLCHFLNL